MSGRESDREGTHVYKKGGGKREGRVGHRELMCGRYDGREEVGAAEYMPIVLQFALSEEYDSLQTSRATTFL